MEPLSAAKPLYSILNRLAERTMMLDKTQADLKRASSRAVFIAGVQVTLLQLELGLLLSSIGYKSRG